MAAGNRGKERQMNEQRHNNTNDAQKKRHQVFGRGLGVGGAALGSGASSATGAPLARRKSRSHSSQMCPCFEINLTVVIIIVITRNITVIVICWRFLDRTLLVHTLGLPCRRRGGNHHTAQLLLPILQSVNGAILFCRQRIDCLINLASALGTFLPACAATWRDQARINFDALRPWHR